ncbi:MAG: universal stress protein [Woeseiaceae bacterium]|nr:universal stress protein [Woeseiaceae bacterium]
MSESAKILVVVEPDNHPQDVVDRAGWLATLTDCDLHLLLCDAAITPTSFGIIVSNEARDIARHIRDAQLEMIDELAQPARDQGITVETEILEERPVADAVLHRALEIEPRYLLKGTEYHSAAERAIFVDTDWQLIRTCPYPLWLIKPRKLSKTPVIIAAVDPLHSHDKPAELDQLIVDTAKAIGESASAEIHLFHTYKSIIGIGREATRTFKPIKLPVDELSEKIEAQHRQQLDALARANNIDAKNVHQLPGDTRDVLPSFARSEGADVIVMGALARWGFKRMVIGSTAERVLDHLPCDILIVRLPQQKSANVVAV